MESTKCDLIIVGGGITGLVSGFLAARSGKKVKIFEANLEFGGLLGCFDVQNNSLEKFYHHFFTHDVELKWLVSELSLTKYLMFKRSSMAVLHGNELSAFETPFDLLKFKHFSFIDKLRFALTSIYLGKLAKWRQFEKYPALKWLENFAGKNVVDVLWRPLIKVKFGPYSENLPLSWLIGRLRQRMGSRSKGGEHLGYIDGSLNLLLTKLLTQLKTLGVELCAGSPVDEIVVANDRMLSLKVHGKFHSASQYLFTIPTPKVAQLFKNVDQLIFENLSQIKYFGAVCVVLELSENLSDYYWINVANDHCPFGGIIEHTNLVSPDNYGGRHIVYLSKYFDISEKIARAADQDIIETFLQSLLKIFPDLSQEKILRAHVFRSNTAANVCPLGFGEIVPECELPIKGAFLANMPHVYPDERSVNNSIRVAIAACTQMNFGHLPKLSSNSLSAKIGFTK